jgi:hypothetical protein
MTNGAVVAGSAGAAATVNAIKASGVLVAVSPEDFQSILRRAQGALVVHAPGSFFSRRHQYLLGYKGFAFFTKSRDEISLPAGVEKVEARKVWVPG